MNRDVGSRSYADIENKNKKYAGRCGPHKISRLEIPELTMQLFLTNKPLIGLSENASQV